LFCATYGVISGGALNPTPLEALSASENGPCAAANGHYYLQDKGADMAEVKQLAATVRSGTGKGAARSVRREGRIPGVIYGGGEAPQPISLDHKQTNHAIFSGHFLTTIFEIDVGGRKERVIPRDYQLDVVKDTPLHVDFLRLRQGSRLRVEVPVRFINHDQSPGIKRGGTLNVVRHAVEMTVPADNIPEAIIGDLAGLDINDGLHISAFHLPEGCQPTISGRDFTVATIAPPTTYKEEAPATAAATTTAPAVAAAAPAAAPAKDAKDTKASAPAKAPTKETKK
jgi:large subunit ribosomal protein L25